MMQIEAAGPNIPLGKPIANVTLYVLDEARNAVQPGESGELYIGGKGLAAGYWLRPDLTEERFIYKRIQAGSDTRLYRTGDRVRLLADVGLEFLGRSDGQIKLRRFRV